MVIGASSSYCPRCVQVAVFMSRWNAGSAMQLDWLPRSIKWYWGIFPAAFAGLTALPDFLFGTSAVWLLTQHSDWMQNDASLFWQNRAEAAQRAAYIEGDHYHHGRRS
jgi:hypothetical protein